MSSVLEKFGIEPWYAAHFALGATQGVFIPILVPTFVLEVTGQATVAGIAMAIIGLGGLVAPVVGGLADKFRMHRYAQLLGLVAYACAGLVFATIGSTMLGVILGAACFGLGSATLLMINPAFIVAAGFAPEVEANRLTRLNQTMIFGTLVTGIVLSVLTSAGLSYSIRFLIVTVVAVLAFVITFATNAAAAARIKTPESSTEATAGAADQSAGFGNLLFSKFGVLLIAIFLVSTGHGVITGQFPNYMDKVFTIDPAQSTLVLSVSAVVTLLTLDLIGRWMGRSGPAPVWLTAVGMKATIMAVLGTLAIITGGNVMSFLPLGLYLIYMQGIAWADMTQPALVARASTAGAGLTQGLLMFAIALAFGVGGFLGGTFADGFGFQSLAWLTAAVSLGAIVLGFVSAPKIAD